MLVEPQISLRRRIMVLPSTYCKSLRTAFPHQPPHIWVVSVPARELFPPQSRFQDTISKNVQVLDSRHTRSGEKENSSRNYCNTRGGFGLEERIARIKAQSYSTSKARTACSRPRPICHEMQLINGQERNADRVPFSTTAVPEARLASC